MSKFDWRLRGGVVALALAAAAAPQTAFAQAGASASDDAIIVTAQRRAQDLQDVGISVAAFNAATLESLGATASTDIARLTPGVHLSGNSGGQNVQFTIRGVNQNDFLDFLEAPVAVYVDQGYVASPQGQVFALFDLERVEVLKGPQGTLFGRNATGGLVHYISRAPTDTFEASAKVSYGSYNSVEVESAISGPLAPGVAGRLSGVYRRHDEIMDNRYDPATAVNDGGALARGGEDIWNDDTWALRGQVRFEPSSDVQIMLRAHGGRAEMSESPFSSYATVAEVDAQGRVIGAQRAGPNETREAIGPGGVNANVSDFLAGPAAGTRPTPGGDFFGYRDADGDGLDVAKDGSLSDLDFVESHGAQAEITWEGPGFDLVSISDYRRLEKFVYLDVEASPTSLIDFATAAETKTFSQEVRLSGERDRWRWLVGAYYLHIDADNTNGFLYKRNSIGNVIFGTQGVGIDLINQVRLKTDSYSLFGQGEAPLSETLTLVGGLRLIREEQDYTLNPFAYLNENDFGLDTRIPLFPLENDFSDKRTEDLWAGTLQLQWRPKEDLLLYASVNRGVKAGNYNAKLADGTPALTDEQIPYDPEVLTAYEIGWKSQWADRALQLNGAVFYYDYKDYQAFTWLLSGTVTNRDARTIGVEADAVIRPNEDWTFRLAGAHFDATVYDVEIAPGVFRDVEPTYSPKTQLSASARYDVPQPLFGGALALELDASWTDDFYHNLRNFESSRLDGYGLLNGRVSWESEEGGWSVALAGQNLLDERYEVVGFEISPLCGCNEVSYGKPRWVTLSIGKKF